MTLKAEETLEVTLTPAVMDSYSAAHSVLSGVLLTASEPQSLEEVILSDEALNSGGEALYWLQNLTDMPLEFWTRGPGQGGRALPIAFKPSDLGELTRNVSKDHLACPQRIYWSSARICAVVSVLGVVQFKRLQPGIS